MGSWNDVKSYDLNSDFFIHNGAKILKNKMCNGHVIRPLGNFVSFYEYCTSVGGVYRFAICLDPQNCVISQKYNLQAEPRCAINVIHRPSNEIRVFKGSLFNFKSLKQFYVEFDLKPGGTQGGEFKIEHSTSSKYKSANLKLHSNHLLTDEDKNLIKTQGLYDLHKVFQAIHPNKIENYLLGDGKLTEDKEDDDKSNKEEEKELISLDDLF